MRRLETIEEFKTEASDARFTKQQAVAVTMQLLEGELRAKENSPEEVNILAKAIAHAEFRYLDATKTGTDRMLDDIGVARFTAVDIVNAIEAILFDAQ